MTSRLAHYSLVFAILCALAAIVSGLGYRWSWWSLGGGFGILRWAAYGAIVATALAIAGTVVSRRNRKGRDFTSAVIALLVGAATFGIPGMMLIKAEQLPSIHDITTDTSDPPKFVAVLPYARTRKTPPTTAGRTLPLDNARRIQKSRRSIRTRRPRRRLHGRSTWRARWAGTLSPPSPPKAASKRPTRHCFLASRTTSSSALPQRLKAAEPTCARNRVLAEAMWEPTLGVLQASLIG